MASGPLQSLLELECTRSHFLAYWRMLTYQRKSPFPVGLPPLRHNVLPDDLTATKTTLSEEVASTDKPALHSSPKAVVPKLGLRSALNGDTAIRALGAQPHLSPSALLSTPAAESQGDYPRV